MTTDTATSYQRLREHLAFLRLTTAAEHLSPSLDRALKEHLSPTQVLEQLLDLEVNETKARRRRARLRHARYPVIKTLADFDFESGGSGKRPGARRPPYRLPPSTSTILSHLPPGSL